MSSALTKIASWVASVELNQIPKRVQKKARYQILNVVASQYASQYHGIAQNTIQCIENWNRAGNCTVLPSGAKLTLHDAVLANAISTMALDYDDYLYMGHTGHSAVVASWALCEELKLSSDDLLLLTIIGNEVAGRLGITTALGPQNGQAWSYIHALGAAAITSRAYNFSPEQTAHALAIAMYQPGFTLWPGFMGAESKLLTAAWPLVQGIQAAQFAAQGMTGSLDILEHPNKGFWKFFTYVPLPLMLGGLGKAWLSDSLTFKKYPGCAYIDTTMDALFALMDEYNNQSGVQLDWRDIKEINIHANLLTMEMDNLSYEYRQGESVSQTTVNFSIPYNVALGLIAERLTASEVDQANIDRNSGVLNAICKKVTMTHDWGMTFAVINSVNKCLGPQSISAVLGIKQWRELIKGLAGQLGGERKHSLNLLGLWQNRTLLFKLLLERISNKRNYGVIEKVDLGNVNFEEFEMTFPAEVEITLNNGQSLKCRRDIPIGAGAQSEYYSMVEDKFLIESGGFKNSEKILETLSDQSRFLSSNPSELSDMICDSFEKEIRTDQEEGVV